MNTNASQKFLERTIGNARPTATQAARRITPITDATAIGAFFLYTKKPNAIASGMNSKDAVATDPFASLPVNEFATISAKAAITSNNTSHANTVKRTLLL
jgi:hypothetical protein